MLHRSFKPAKCKTALRLTVSRIKLLKNKSASHVTQLRREVAQLLEDWPGEDCQDSSGTRDQGREDNGCL
ncbi:unnamed protein product [Rhodiola kirilowii]